MGVCLCRVSGTVYELDNGMVRVSCTKGILEAVQTTFKVGSGATMTGSALDIVRGDFVAPHGSKICIRMKNGIVVPMRPGDRLSSYFVGNGSEVVVPARAIPERTLCTLL